MSAAAVLLIALLGPVGGASASVPSPVCSTVGPTTTCVYASTGAEQTFTVPAGVTSIDVVAQGAAGSTAHFSPDSPGGEGAVVSGTLPVTAGTRYV